MFGPFLASFGLIFLAELGDKTNFLVFYLASRYRLKVVVLPIFLAIFFLEAIAVFFGSFLRNLLPSWFSLALSGLVFLLAFFWLWQESEKEEELKDFNSASGLHLSLIIFSSFFLAELGDKTQLATFALASRFEQPLLVLMGGTLGMFSPNLVVALFGEKVANFPQIRIFHKAGAFLFLLFAFLSIYELFRLLLG